MLCNGAVNFVLHWDTKATFRIAAIQSAAGRRLSVRCGRDVDDLSSIVLVYESSHYTRSEAVLRIGEKLSRPIPFISLICHFLPLSIRDTVYDTIGRYRYNIFGKQEECRLMDTKYASRFIVE